METLSIALNTEYPKWPLTKINEDRWRRILMDNQYNHTSKQKNINYNYTTK